MSGINTYSLTNYIASNNVVNRAIMELGGYAAPNVMMANNKVEARERAEKAAMFFGFSMILPVACTAVLNKIFLKHYGITDKFNGQRTEIIQLPRKYLTRNDKYMCDGIDSLKNDFKDKKNYKDIENGINHVLNKFPDKELLRTRLIKANNKILVGDFLLSGICMSSIYWVSNFITKHKTGRDGFSAEFEMADKKIIDDKAKKYKERQKKNFVASFGILALSSLTLSVGLSKGMLSGKNTGFSKFIKNNISKFDYKDGIYMSKLTLFLIFLFGDIPSTLLASRDKEELKYNAIKNTFFNGLFFGGDLILNNIAARALDKHCGTKLVNKDDLKPDASWIKRMTCPLYSFKELNEKTDLAPEVLNKTKKCAVRMFWGNFSTILLILGFGTPILLNKMVKKGVEKDVEKYEQSRKPQNTPNNQQMYDFLNKHKIPG